MTINAHVLGEYFTKGSAFAKKKTPTPMATEGAKLVLLNINISPIAKTSLARHTPMITEKIAPSVITLVKNAMGQRRRIV
jgi:hypothetical protein